MTTTTTTSSPATVTATEPGFHVGPLSLAHVAAAIRASWTAQTSASEHWSPTNPALGQCAVSALVLQDYAGGDLRRTTVHGVSHYYNVLPEGEVDLTREQFPSWEPTPPTTGSRDYMLSFPATVARYERLRAAVRSRLATRRAA